LGTDVDAGPVGLEDIPGRGETEPETVGLGSEIGLEDPGDVLLGDATSVVVDPNLIMLRRFLPDNDSDDAGLRRNGLDCIDEDIEQGDLQLFFIGHDESRPFRISQLEPYILQRDAIRCRRQRGIDDLLQPRLLQADLGGTGKVQQLGYQSIDPPAIAGDDIQVDIGIFAIHLRFQLFHRKIDIRQRVPHFVRQCAKQGGRRPKLFDLEGRSFDAFEIGDVVDDALYIGLARRVHLPGDGKDAISSFFITRDQLDLEILHLSADRQTVLEVGSRFLPGKEVVQVHAQQFVLGVFEEVAGGHVHVLEDQVVGGEEDRILRTLENIPELAFVYAQGPRICATFEGIADTSFQLLGIDLRFHEEIRLPDRHGLDIHVPVADAGEQHQGILAAQGNSLPQQLEAGLFSQQVVHEINIVLTLPDTLDRVVIVIAPIDAELLVRDVLDAGLDDEEVVLIVFDDQYPGRHI